MDCPNSRLCFVCSKQACCYHKYLEGEINCRHTCICRPLCKSSANKREKAIEIDFNEIPEFVKVGRIKNPCIGIPASSRYIPQIPVRLREAKNALKLVDEAELDAIAISLGDFFTPNGDFNKYYREAKIRKLHNYLDYDGYILLTTDIKDFLCDQLSRSKLIDMIYSLEPNGVTTYDTYCYDDQPSFVTQIKMVEALKGTRETFDELNTEAIGLAIGPPNKLFEWYSSCLVEMGGKVLAIPCYEVRVRGKKQERVGPISHRIKFLRDNFPSAEIILLSVSASRAFKVFSADYYSSLTWFIVKEKNRVRKNKLRLERLLRYKQLTKKYGSQRMVSLNGRGEISEKIHRKR